MATDEPCRICMWGDRLHGILITFVLIDTIMPLDAILVRLSAPTSGAYLNHEAKTSRNEGKMEPPTTAALKACFGR